MDPVFDHQVPFSPHAAVVVCRTEHGNVHAGILHSKNEVLHLGWEDIMSTQWPWRKLWLVPDAEPEELFGVAAMCRLIWENFKQERSFPYGICFGDSTFDRSGKLVPGAKSKGLTCATFVLAVFESMCITLVEQRTWPVRTEDDRKWLDSLSSIASPDVYERLKNEIDEGVVRIRPEEVSGACVHRCPCEFDKSATASIQVLVRLDTEI